MAGRPIPCERPNVPVMDTGLALRTRYLMTIAVQAAMPSALGNFPLGERRFIAFTGGTFRGAEGEDLQGTIAGGGVDWQTVRADGAVEIRAHYLLITDRHEHIEVQSDGLRIFPPEVAALAAAGEAVDPASYYFRTHIRLFTESSRLAHLNERIAVSTGERQTGCVHVHVHQVL